MAKQLEIPTLHSGQIDIYKDPNRFKAVCCGRRWGKTELGKAIAMSGAAKGQSIGWLAPDYKIMSEAYNQILDALEPIKKSASKNDGVISTTTGGRIDFWSLENERAGRSRKYHHVILDEVAFAKDSTMTGIWEKSIKPTLLDYRGKCIALSTPNGVNEENWFYKICHYPELGFKMLHAPTHTNPYLPPDELLKLELENEPRVYRQEYLAEFVSWGAEAIFNMDKLLVDGKPVATPVNPDTVYAVIDTAVKTGTEHDGTAVVYFAISPNFGHPVTILDWELLQIEGDLLINWLPMVYERLDELQKETKSLYPSAGTYIEDRGSGSILLMAANRRGWGARPIDTKLTQVGKDERAIAVSGYVYQGHVKITDYAYNKTVRFKGADKNHLVNQLSTFRVGDKDRKTRSDDLMDCTTYGISIGMGDAYGV